MLHGSTYPQILMEAGFKIIPGKEAEFIDAQNRMVPLGMEQPGFVAVYGGEIADSSWLYFSVRFASPQTMSAWHEHRGHKAMQRGAYDKWWTAMYIRKWQRPQGDALSGDRLLCETLIARDAPLGETDKATLKAAAAGLQQFNVKQFETLTGQYEAQPYQFVGPLDIAPTPAAKLYVLISHWRSADDLKAWQQSDSYKKLSELGHVSSEAFVPYAEPENRDLLRDDKLQRDWTLATKSA
jgi:heme-degrading monooxygenase HmoA